MHPGVWWVGSLAWCIANWPMREICLLKGNRIDLSVLDFEKSHCHSQKFGRQPSGWWLSWLQISFYEAEGGVLPQSLENLTFWSLGSGYCLHDDCDYITLFIWISTFATSCTFKGALAYARTFKVERLQLWRRFSHILPCCLLLTFAQWSMYPVSDIVSGYHQILGLFIHLWKAIATLSHYSKASSNKGMQGNKAFRKRKIHAFANSSLLGTSQSFALHVCVSSSACWSRQNHCCENRSGRANLQGGDVRWNAGIHPGL